MYLRAKNSRIKMALSSGNTENQVTRPVLDLNLQVRKINSKMELKLEVEQCQVLEFFRQMIEESLKDHFRFVCLEEEASCSELTSDKVKRISSYSIDRKSALSGREVEILEKISMGWSNRKIADYFELAETTVKSHVQSIFLKLGVKSRHKAGIEYRNLFENRNNISSER